MTTTLEVEEKTVSPLRHLHNTATSLEKFRIQLSNRVSAITRGVDDAPQIYVDLADAILQLEQKVDDSIAVELKRWPVYHDWLSHVKGIGPSLSGQMLSLLLPPIPGKGPSSWYKAAGLAPELRPDGLSRLPRARAGEGKITYHPWLRRCLWNVATSFVRNGGYYREVYEGSRERLFSQHCWGASAQLATWRAIGETARLSWLKENVSAVTLDRAITGTVGEKDEMTGIRVARKISPEEWASAPTQAKALALWAISDETWPLHRIDSVARWRTVKLFLSHLWEQWCAIEGIVCRSPYVLEYGGHDAMIPAPQWNGKEKI